jgi:LmbE family N-acetylglucosaminyl deacetylase
MSFGGVNPNNTGPILAIAAHPGDGMFTMGATVAQHIANGGTGTFFSLSLGEKGHNSIPVGEYGEMQREAMEQASASLGAESSFLSYPDAEIPFNEEASLAVCDEIRRVKPSIIITHWQGSWHKDHVNCHEIVQYAQFYAGLKTLAREHPPHYAGQLFYAENWEDMDGFNQDTYMDISDVYEQWQSACAVFPMWRGETGFRYNDYYSSLAIMRGCLGGFAKAVALMTAEGQRVKKLKRF